MSIEERTIDTVRLGCFILEGIGKGSTLEAAPDKVFPERILSTSLPTRKCENHLICELTNSGMEKLRILSSEEVEAVRGATDLYLEMRDQYLEIQVHNYLTNHFNANRLLGQDWIPVCFDPQIFHPYPLSDIVCAMKAFGELITDTGYKVFIHRADSIQVMSIIRNYGAGFTPPDQS